MSRHFVAEVRDLILGPLLRDQSWRIKARSERLKVDGTAATFGGNTSEPGIVRASCYG